MTNQIDRRAVMKLNAEGSFCTISIIFRAFRACVAQQSVHLPFSFCTIAWTWRSNNLNEATMSITYVLNGIGQLYVFLILWSPILQFKASMKDFLDMNSTHVVFCRASTIWSLTSVWRRTRRLWLVFWSRELVASVRRLSGTTWASEKTSTWRFSKSLWIYTSSTT